MADTIIKPKTVADCQCDAVELVGLLTALKIMRENDLAPNSQASVIRFCVNVAEDLASDLDDAREFR